MDLGPTQWEVKLTDGASLLPPSLGGLTFYPIHTFDPQQLFNRPIFTPSSLPNASTGVLELSNVLSYSSLPQEVGCTIPDDNFRLTPSFLRLSGEAMDALLRLSGLFNAYSNVELRVSYEEDGLIHNTVVLSEPATDDYLWWFGNDDVSFIQITPTLGGWLARKKEPEPVKDGPWINAAIALVR